MPHHSSSSFEDSESDEHHHHPRKPQSFEEEACPCFSLTHQQVNVMVIIFLLTTLASTTTLTVLSRSKFGGPLVPPIDVTTDREPHPHVRASWGDIRGDYYAGGELSFYATIPYAEPPVGPLRFADPVLKSTYSEMVDATVVGPKCFQDPYAGEDDFQSEDCLTLSVIGPTRVWDAELKQYSGNWPVMVFFHGGSFEYGSASDPNLNTVSMARFAQENVKTPTIIVSVQYRLGALGFLALPSTNSPTGVGNFGLKDQVAALQWIKTHISDFGGDVGAITIFGHSAGSMSVCAHMARSNIYVNSALFQRVIMQSGGCTTPNLFPAKAPAVARGTQVATALGCNFGTNATILECLRMVDVSALVETSVQYSVPLPGFVPLKYGPIIDGVFLSEDPATYFLTRGFPPAVAIMAGTTSDDGSVFVWERYPFELNEEFYNLILELIFGATAAPLITAQYPYAEPAQDVLGQIVTDLLFYCDTRSVVMAAAMDGTIAPSVYNYVFDFIPNYAIELGFSYLGSFHGAELQYVFNQPHLPEDIPFVPDELPVRNTMLGYWIKFAATGDPSLATVTTMVGSQEVTTTLPTWPKLTVLADNQFFLPISAALTGYRANFCTFWGGLASASSNGRALLDPEFVRHAVEVAQERNILDVKLM